MNREHEIIGSKIDYFITQTNARLEKIDRKLEQLINFRLMLLGGAATLSVMISVLTSLIVIVFGRS